MNTNSESDVAERIRSAIYATDVSRAVVEHEWPECHAKRCQGSHPNPDMAFSIMKGRIAESVFDELAYRATSRPVFFAHDGMTPRESAEATLAVLMDTYFDKTGRFIRAAEMIVEAYPELVGVLNGTSQNALVTDERTKK